MYSLFRKQKVKKLKQKKKKKKIPNEIMNSWLWLTHRNFLFLYIVQFKELNTGKLTVGKIYGGLLILENWKTTRFGQIEASASTVCWCGLICMTTFIFLLLL
jgi:hypothetical protein